jgi:hypothetical protein
MIFVAAFNHEDPGSLAVAQRCAYHLIVFDIHLISLILDFGLPLDIVAAALDSLDIVQIAMLESQVSNGICIGILLPSFSISQIPNNVAQGTADCLARCGISAVNQPTTQRQPRLPSNALPSGFSGPPPPPPVSTTPSAALASALQHNPTGAAAIVTGSAIATDNMPQSIWSDKNVKAVLIALLAINGLFVVGLLIALFLFMARKRAATRGRTRDGSIPHFAPLADEKLEYYDPYHRTPSPVTPETR